METLERWLRKRSLIVSLLLALGVSWGLGTGGVVSDDVMPFGDSEHYVLRGMTLYGYLHSGQWSRFWDVFTLPNESLAPFHYWLFFLLPQAWAGMISYGVIQALATYGLLALGAWGLCRALDRAEWAPALFLLCATQNISLDYSYFYFADVPFLALGLVAMRWQVRAWREVSWRNSLLSGAGAGLMFWVKAPNAIIFVGTYLVAEIVRIVLVACAEKGERTRVWQKNLGRHGLAVAAGFIPMAFFALACGGFQSIIKLIDTNEVSGLFATTLQCTGLFRFFYFPLCLTFFYHTVAMVLIFAAMGLAAFFLNRNAKAPFVPPSLDARFPATLLLPLIVAYLALGEFFSFGMEFKVMRSLLLVLPVLWLSVFWLLEYWRVRPALMLLAAVAYAVCGFSQTFFNAFGTTDISADSYQLKDDWLTRLPQPHSMDSSGIGITKGLLGLIHQALPDGGKVAVGTEQLYLTSESLTWGEEHDLALQGKPVAYEFNNFLTNDGQYSRRSLSNARAILVVVHPSLQYSQKVYEATLALLQFCAGPWLKEGFVHIIPIQSEGNPVLGYLVVTKEPLNDERITQLIMGAGGGELASSVEFGSSNDRRLSWDECVDILLRWRQKRMIEPPP